ncbi:MAG: hypothetical protein LUC43_03655 [Burkholderiales bacterium]|nr:hypothetical protein [Burkholderiales bacterium]
MPGKDPDRELANLIMRAHLQRAQLEEQIWEIRSRPKLALGMSTLRTARDVGMSDPELVMKIGKSILLPIAIATTRLLIKKGLVKRSLGVAAIVLAAFGIAKGIQYDKWKQQQQAYFNDPKLLPVVEPEEPLLLEEKPLTEEGQVK